MRDIFILIQKINQLLDQIRKMVSVLDLRIENYIYLFVLVNNGVPDHGSPDYY